MTTTTNLKGKKKSHIHVQSDALVPERVKEGLGGWGWSGGSNIGSAHFKVKLL